MPRSVDSCVKDGTNHQKVEKHARPLGIVNQAQAKEVKKHNSALNKFQKSHTWYDNNTDFVILRIKGKIFNIIYTLHKNEKTKKIPYLKGIKILKDLCTCTVVQQINFSKYPTKICFNISDLLAERNKELKSNMSSLTSL